MLAYIHVRNHLNNRNKSYNPCEAPVQAFRAKTLAKICIWESFTFVRKKKSMEGSRSMTFTHNVCRLGYDKNYR